MTSGTVRDLPIVVSMVAGAGGGRDRESRLRTLLGRHFTPRYFYPASVAKLHTLVADLAANARHIGVAGGDGTLHQVVNALGDRPAILVPFPSGSGNDFCRALGLTDAPDAPVRALLSGKTRRIDLIEVNAHRVCTVAGIGIVAATGVQMARLMAPNSTWRPLLRAIGPYSYLGAAALRVLLAPGVTAGVRVRWRCAAGGWMEASSPLHGIFLANVPTLGVGLRLPVPSDSHDGAIELVRLPANPRFRLLRGLLRLRSGHPVPDGVIDVSPVIEAEIEWPGGSALLGDGEDLGRFDRFRVRALHGAIEVVSL